MFAIATITKHSYLNLIDRHQFSWLTVPIHVCTYLQDTKSYYLHSHQTQVHIFGPKYISPGHLVLLLLGGLTKVLLLWKHMQGFCSGCIVCNLDIFTFRNALAPLRFVADFD